MPWDEVVELFSEHDFTDCAPCPGGQRCKKKFSMAFSPGIPREGLTRLDKNIGFVSLLVFDIDHVTRAELEGVCERIAGLESLICSTHSHLHKGPDDNCVRIIFPLERPLRPTEFRHVHREVRRRYQLEWLRPGAAKTSGADPTTKDLSRLYFLPTAPIGTETITGREEGALLDLEEILSSLSPELNRPRNAPAPSAPHGPYVERTADMEVLRNCLRSYSPRNREKDDDKVITRKELARRVERSEALVKPEERGVREESCHRIGKILANCLPEGTSREAILELVRPSIMALPVYEDDGEEDTYQARFDKVAFSFERGLIEREQQKEAFLAKRAQDDEFRVEFKRRFGSKKATSEGETAPTSDDEDEGPAETPAPDLADELNDESELTDADFEGWEDLLLKSTKKDGSEGGLKNVDSNVEAILAYSPEWRRRLRYNEVTKEVTVSAGPLLDHEMTASQITTGVKYWLQRKHGLNVRKNDVMDAILHVAKWNSYDPVSDYLNSVRWDGAPRIDLFLETYCNARTTDESGKNITNLVRRMGRCWLISAVARGLTPGCKVDTVLIFEGEQGVKKSTMLDVLGGEWFTDSPIVIGDKDSKMLAGCNWIAELAELSAMHASAVDQQKAFFSSRVDKFRPPYGYAVEKFLRRCVFGGSTNSEKYMNDITGNRRFWPVWCTKFEIRRARRDRDQIWAEAVAVYKAGLTCIDCAAAKDGEDRCAEHRWWFTEAENRELEKINNQRLKNDYSDVILDFILKLDPPSTPPKVNQRPASYTIYEIATEILKIPADRVSAQQAAIGRTLKVLGFTKSRPRVNGSQTVYHVLPEELLRAKKKDSKDRATNRHLQVVPDPPEMSPPPDTEEA